MMRALILLLALAACVERGEVVVDRPKTVSVLVSTPCVSGERPATVEPLKTLHPDWYGYTPKQKTELAGAQALRHKNYGEATNAATSACK